MHVLNVPGKVIVIATILYARKDLFLQAIGIQFATRFGLY